jgi:hypothetical protein
MLRRYAFLLCLTFASAPAFAHTELPHPIWCEGGTMHEVASFSFTPQMLAAQPPLEICPADQGGSGSGLKNCGQFDDDYKRGYDASQMFCHAYSRPHLIGEVPDAGSVIVVVTYPLSFTSAEHHAAYAITSGLQGVCMRCEGKLSAVAPIRTRDD